MMAVSPVYLRVDTNGFDLSFFVTQDGTTMALRGLLVVVVGTVRMDGKDDDELIVKVEFMVG